MYTHNPNVSRWVTNWIHKLCTSDFQDIRTEVNRTDVLKWIVHTCTVVRRDSAPDARHNQSHNYSKGLAESHVNTDAIWRFSFNTVTLYAIHIKQNWAGRNSRLNTRTLSHQAANLMQIEAILLIHIVSQLSPTPCNPLIITLRSVQYVIFSTRASKYKEHKIKCGKKAEMPVDMQWDGNC